MISLQYSEAVNSLECNNTSNKTNRYTIIN